MITVDFEERERRTKFVEDAATWFSRNPEGRTYTQGEIVEGNLIGIRWGLGNDCVLVFEIAKDVELYPQVIKRNM